MSTQELINKVNVVLADEFEIEVSDISAEGNIKETLELDSLSLVDMVALIEESFGVKINNQEIASIQTFENLYTYIDSKLKNAA